MALSSKSRRTGSVLVLMAVLLPVALAVAAFCINIVYMELTRTQLQVTTDVATRAAGRTLAVTRDKQKAKDAADRMLSLNLSSNSRFKLGSKDFVFGASTRGSEIQRYRFQQAATQPNAIQFETSGKVELPMLFPTMGVPISYRPIKSAISTQTEVDIVLVVDRSSSMAFSSSETSGLYPPSSAPPGWFWGMPVPPNSRWLDAVNSISGFLTYLESTVHQERVGVVTYSDLALLNCPLTESYEQVRLSTQLHTFSFWGGSTNLGVGILTGVLALSDKARARPWASRIMVVLTDGIGSSIVDPKLIATLAASQNIEIHTITFSAEADLTRMQEIAQACGGKHYHANSGAELTKAFDAISRTLPTLITH